jgi:uncharacterized YigZ family protein
MKDEYHSIRSDATKTLKIEGSKFIASAYPVESRLQAEEKLKRVRKKFFDATHNCFAYALGSERKEFRYSDDGEPSGTAGVKIYSAIESKNLSDILVVVTRYFGGTKLGVGGLGRAYFASASGVLASSVVVRKIVGEGIEIVFPYDETNGVMNMLSRYNAGIIDTVYGDTVTLRISIRQGAAVAFLKDLTQVTRGNLAAKYLSPSTQTK